MATLSAQSMSQDGINPTYVAAAAGGDKFVHSPRRFVIIKNDGGAPITATFNSLSDCNQGFDHDIDVSIPAGQLRVIGPLLQRFADSSGFVNISYSSVTSVSIALLQTGA